MTKKNTFESMTKLELEKMLFLISGTECAKLYSSSLSEKKEISYDELTEILIEVRGLGYMELHNDIINKNLEVAKEEFEKYDNMPDLPFWEFAEKQLDKNMEKNLRNILKNDIIKFMHIG